MFNLPLFCTMIYFFTYALGAFSWKFKLSAYALALYCAFLGVTFIPLLHMVCTFAAGWMVLCTYKGNFAKICALKVENKKQINTYKQKIRLYLHKLFEGGEDKK